MDKKFERSINNKIIFGVCGGLGKYFSTDPIIFRFAFVALLLAGGSSLIIYFILLIIMPKEPRFVVADVQENANSFETVQQDDLKTDTTSASTEKNSLLFGLSLISIGVMLLLNNLVPYFKIGKLWPAILVIIGLGLLFKGKTKQEN